MHKPRRSMAIAALLLLSATAVADAGSPLVFALGAHLLLANALFGLLEGLILAWCLSLPKKRAVAFFIAANYFSAWIGAAATFSIAQSLRLDIYTYWTVLNWLLAASFLLTLLCEAPFLVFLCRKTTCTWPRVIIVFALAQTASYVLLAGWYTMFSRTSLLTDTVLVRPSQMVARDDLRLYYISADDGDVYEQRLLGPSVKFFDHELKIEELDLLRNPHDGDRWNLVAWVDRGPSSARDCFIVKESFCSNATQRFSQGYVNLQEGRIDRWYGPALRVGSANDSSWDVDFFVMGGIRGYKSDKTEDFFYAFECPWAMWPLVNVTHLPGDQILFNLDYRQICLLDIATKKLAVIAHGSHPVVVLAETPAAEPSNSSYPAQ